MKNRVLLENYFLPGDLERQISAFVDHYNNRRYHESLQNLGPSSARRANTANWVVVTSGMISEKSAKCRCVTRRSR